MNPFEWDAQRYDAMPLPHQEWGRQVVARLTLSGNETVADLGCGTGRDTDRLLRKLPRGRVVAVDGSRQMLAQLRHRLAPQLGRVETLFSDLRDPLPMQRQVDVVISVATLHWLPDHAALFRNIAAVLRPGGEFVAEAGGRGNITNVRHALRNVAAVSATEPWNFADVPETVNRLEASGFRDVRVRLVPDPVRLEGGMQIEAFLATVVLGAHLRDLATDAERNAFVTAVAANLPEPAVDYVRLQIHAIRA